MVRLRSAPATQPTTAPAPAPTQKRRTALREKTNTARAQKASSVNPDEASKDLVKNAKSRRGRTAKNPTASDGIMDGDNEEDAPGAHVEEADTIVVKQTQENEPPKTSRRPPRMTRKPIRTEAQGKVLDGLKQRMDATAREVASSVKATQELSRSAAPVERPAARMSNAATVERSEFSLSLSPSPPRQMNTVKGSRVSHAPPGSALRVQGTPAHEMSIMALKNFKRRPRQPSMLQMVQQHTMSARPSLANAQADEDPSVFDLEASEDEDEFEPEAEGTPVQAREAKPTTSGRSRRKTASTVIVASSPVGSRKRKSGEISHHNQLSAMEALRQKRRKSDAQIEEPTSPVEVRGTAHHASSDRQETPQAQITSDVQVLNSSPSSTPPTEPSSSDRQKPASDANLVVPSTEQDELYDLSTPPAQEDEVPNQTIAEPASSPLPSLSPPAIGTQDTDIYADPVTQHSPPPKARQKSKAKSKPLATDMLKSLLPKRRKPVVPRHGKSEFDFVSDDNENSDEDELSRNPKRPTKATPAKRSRATAAKGKKQQQPSAKPRKSAVPASTAKNPGRTYSRKGNASDKENEGYESANAHEDEDTIALPETSRIIHDASKELEAAKRKFEEVDGWEMSFESITPDDHRSSSLGWR